jgi:hypothetical protein
VPPIGRVQALNRDARMLDARVIGDTAADVATPRSETTIVKDRAVGHRRELRRSTGFMMSACSPRSRLAAGRRPQLSLGPRAWTLVPRAPCLAYIVERRAPTSHMNPTVALAAA